VATITRPLRALKPRSPGASVIAVAAAVALFYYGRSFLVTLTVALVLAFILEPFVALLMRIRFPRALASFVVCTFAALALYLLGLGFYTEAAGLVEDSPKYAQRIDAVSEQVLAGAESVERTIYETVVPKHIREQDETAAKQRRRRGAASPIAPSAQNPVPEVRIRPEHPPVVDFLYSHLGSLYEILLMASFVPFLVYFMLSWRDHIHRNFLQMFSDQSRIAASNSLDGIGSMVRAFVVGNFALGLLLSAVSTLFFWWIRLPYPLLIGPLSSFLSLIPYIGLPLGCLPPLVAALAIYDRLAPYILILAVVAALHVITVNLLYPKIVGPRVHLNPLVVTIALMFWSALWGAPGLLLAIPLTAGLKAVCDNVVKLQPFGRLMGN